jgi:hypothetical protein
VGISRRIRKLRFSGVELRNITLDLNSLWQKDTVPRMLLKCLLHNNFRKDMKTLIMNKSPTR